MTTTVGRIKDGDLMVAGELDERLPAVTDGLVAHFPFDGTLKGIGNTNILDYTTWTVGSTGSQSGFSQNGDGNSIIEMEDPFGRATAVWRAFGNDATSNADGGWNGGSFAIDNTKLYRFSTWVRRDTVGNGYFYLGCYGYGSVNGVLNNANGTSNYTNPYFTSRSWGDLPVGEWVLVVGHIFPHDHTDTSMHPDSGYYNTRGERIGSCYRDYRWRPETTSANHRSYLYYSTDATTDQRWVYPRVDICDGSEPTIEDLLRCEGNVVNSVPLAATEVSYGGLTIPESEGAGLNVALGGDITTNYTLRGLKQQFGIESDFVLVKSGESFILYEDGSPTSSYANKWARYISRNVGLDLKSRYFKYYTQLESPEVVSDPPSFSMSLDSFDGGVVWRTFVYSSANVSIWHRYTCDNGGSIRVNGVEQGLGGWNWKTNPDVQIQLRIGWNTIECVYMDYATGGAFRLQSNSQGSNADYSVNPELFVSSTPLSLVPEVVFMSAKMPVEMIGHDVFFQDKAVCTVKAVTIFNKDLTQDEVLRLSRSKGGMKSSGDYQAIELIEQPKVPSDGWYLPLDITTSDRTGVLVPSQSDNVVFEDNSAWVGKAVTNEYAYPTFNTALSIGGWSHWGRTGHRGGYAQNTLREFIYSFKQPYSHKILNDESATGEYLMYQAPGFDGGARSLQVILKLQDGSAVSEAKVFPAWNGVSGGAENYKWTSVTPLHRDFYMCRVDGIIQDGTNDLVGIYVCPGVSAFISQAQLSQKPFYSPFTSSTRGDSALEYNLNSSIGLTWNTDWSIIYWKRPMATRDDNFVSYNIESLGCNSNSVGGSYVWWGKSTGSNSLRDSSNGSFSPSAYFDHWQMVSLVSSGGTITIKTWGIGGRDNVSVRAVTAPSGANSYVTQYGYDFKLGGWDNTNPTNTFFRDLVILQRAATDTELEHMYRAFFTVGDQTRISQSLIEGVTL